MKLNNKGTKLWTGDQPQKSIKGASPKRRTQSSKTWPTSHILRRSSPRIFQAGPSQRMSCFVAICRILSSCRMVFQARQERSAKREDCRQQTGRFPVVCPSGGRPNPEIELQSNKVTKLSTGDRPQKRSKSG